MKKAVKLFISILFAMLPLCGCGSDTGAVISKTELSVSDFSASDTTVVSTAATTVTTTTTTTTAALQLTTCSTSVYCKDTAQLEVSYGDAVRWQSSDTSVAEVDKNGKVTTERAGSAVITAYDSEGNSASCTVESIKVVYLTIDDSPGDYTQSILDTLAEYDIKATFFICGPYSSEKRYNAIISGGHTIANHTKTHEKDVYDSFNALYSEIKEQAKTIKKYTGREALKIFQISRRLKGSRHLCEKTALQGLPYFRLDCNFGRHRFKCNSGILPCQCKKIHHRGQGNSPHASQIPQRKGVASDNRVSSGTGIYLCSHNNGYHAVFICIKYVLTYCLHGHIIQTE